ncbi:D-serine dehydratase [Plakobranchus ocellatus]|uniref:D-serine dehydratase n=1 Tax=Plakobranchus ocellatus TaxID=259542 RepID=A0AAV4D174_9GAST|nr:D-serine dehydratase [Plakobranchus ocellatus]
MKKNTQRMWNTSARLKLKLRPHIEAHKTREGALLQTGGVARCIAVSTLSEAEFYASHGFDDILLAHPISENKVQRCLALMKTMDQFHVLVTGPEGLTTLRDHCLNLTKPKKWSVVLGVDSGHGNAGFDISSQDVIDAALRIKEASYMTLAAVYCHLGDMYSSVTKEEGEAHQCKTIDSLCALKTKFEEAGLKCPFNIGSSLTWNSLVDNEVLFSEFSTGNYIFYDYQLYLSNACRESDIAGRIMTRVVAHKPEANMILVDCGSAALSHDGMIQRLPSADFCLIQGESNLKMVGMSPELGKIVAKEGKLDCSQYPIGTILFIYPFNSCATAAMHHVYYVHSEDQIVAKWTPVRGW